MRTGVADAIRPDRRPPRFRRVPFIRDVAPDPGRATAPRIAAPHVSPSTDENVSAPAILSLSWLTPTPRIIAVYASPRSSPSAPQHSLPGGRYPFPGPDLHRLELASLAWRTPSRLTRYNQRQGGAVPVGPRQSPVPRAAPECVVGLGFYPCLDLDRFCLCRLRHRRLCATHRRLADLTNRACELRRLGDHPGDRPQARAACPPHRAGPF